MDILTVIAGLLGGSIAIIGGICAGVLPLLVLAGVGFYLFRLSQKRSVALQAAQDWPHTSGMVLSSSVRRRRSGTSTSYIPVVVYTYEVKGRVYQGQIVKAGDQHMSVRVTGQAQATVERYPAGTKVKVYYNPADPSECALER